MSPTEVVTQEVTFLAYSENLTLYRKSPRPIREEGIRVGVTEPEEGESPWKIDFKDYRFTTDDPVLIDFLRNGPHGLFNNKTSGIWEEGRAPDEPQPTLAEQTSAIARAAADDDVDGLQEILDLEKDTHNRVPVIQSAESALLAIANRDSTPEPGAGTSGAIPSDSPTTPAD